MLVVIVFDQILVVLKPLYKHVLSWTVFKQHFKTLSLYFTLSFAWLKHKLFLHTCYNGHYFCFIGNNAKQKLHFIGKLSLVFLQNLISAIIASVHYLPNRDWEIHVKKGGIVLTKMEDF